MDAVSFGPFRLYPAQRLLEKGEDPVKLGARAFDILLALVERAGEVVAHKDLIAKVWPNVIVEEISLRVHIASLRKAMCTRRLISSTMTFGQTLAMRSL